MARDVSSPVSSGGGGYSFEDRVGAWLLLHLLRGTSPFDPALGAPLRVKLQARVDGWLLDDFVLEFPPRGGAPVRAAISAKSGRVITTDSTHVTAPTEHVHDSWELHLSPGQTGFDASRDLLVLATSELAPTTRETIQRAVELATTNDPTELDARLPVAGWTNDLVRSFVSSFACPGDLRATHDVRVGRLLRAVRVLDFDFTRGTESENRAVALARECVEGGDQVAAQQLVTELSEFVKTLRTSSATLDLEAVLDRLRGRVALRRHPDYEHDWGRLDRITQDWLADTRDAIGPGCLHLARTSLLDSLRDAVQAQRVAALVGPSGAGKSALVKALAGTEGLLPGPAVCLTVHDLLRWRERGGRHDVVDVIRCQPRPWSLLVIDGVERIVGDDESVRTVARVVRSLRLDVPESPWRLVLTCQTPSSDDVFAALRSREVTVTATRLPVNGLTSPELGEVAGRLPALAALIGRADLGPLTTMPVILDMLAAVADDLPAAGLVGESQLIELFWNRVVRRSTTGGAPLAASLSRLAQEQADSRTFATAVTAVPDPATVGEGVRLSLLLERDETVRFVHDLQADYARQRFLVGQVESGAFDALSRRATNPLWHRALTLLGLRALERNDVASWRRLAETLGVGEAGDAGVDLLLEAIVFAAHPGALLDLLLGDLVARDGELLRRFISRFVAVTTFSGSAERIPAESVWPPIVTWIVAHGDLVLDAAPDEFLSVAGVWLAGNEPRANRSEVAALLLTLAERASEDRSPRLSRRGLRPLWRLALHVADEHRTRVEPLVRRLAGLQVSSGQGARTPEPEGTTGDEDPSGPADEPDEDFLQVAVSTVGAERLSRFDPALAREVFLRLLVERPRRRRSRESVRNCGLRNDHLPGTLPPFWDFAPAERLLAIAAEQGIEFVLQLAQRATDAWEQDYATEHGPYRPVRAVHSEIVRAEGTDSVPAITLRVDGAELRFVGDGVLFEWHRATEVGPYALLASLMSLEHWLNGLEEGPRAAAVSRILRSTRSVAILGVLFEVGLAHPALFLGPLLPLAASAQVHRWALVRRLASHTWMLERDRARLELLRAWHQLPHRAVEFTPTLALANARAVLAGGSAVLPAGTNEEWRALRDAVQDDGARAWLDSLIAWFDLANWQQRPAPEGAADRRDTLEFRAPAAMREQAGAAAAAADAQLRRMTLPIRCLEIVGGRTPGPGEIESMFVFAEGLPDDPPDLAEPLGRRADLRCAVAAAALVAARAWVAEHARRVTACRSWVVQACLSPPPPSPIDPRSGVHELGWDTFAARVLAILWPEAPGDPELRRAVGAFIVGARHDHALGRLFSALAPQRRTLGEDFSRLLHLAVSHARAYYLAHAGIDVELLELRIAEIMTDFVKGELSPLPTDWSRLAGEPFVRSLEPGLLARAAGALASLLGRPAAQPQRHPDGLDLGITSHSLLWIGEAPSTLDSADRAWIATLAGQLAELGTARVRSLTGNRGEFAHPADDEQLAARICAHVVVQEPGSVGRRLVARPWLELPAVGHDWTETYLDALYLSRLEVFDGHAPYFAAALGEAFDTLLGDDGVLARESLEPDVACALLGRFVPWDSSMEQIVRSLGDRPMRWARRCLRLSETCMDAFIRWLLEAAAHHVQLEALPLIADAWADSHGVGEPLALLLISVWADHGVRLVGPARDAFDKLLAALVADQVRAAVALSQVVASTRPSSP